MLGKVKWFDAEKGYGFINYDESKNVDVFVHYSQIVEDGYRFLEEGQEVEFDLTETDRGLQAKNVVKIGL